MEKKKRYESELQAAKRAEIYYPDETLKRELFAFSEKGGNKSGLVTQLLRSYFKSQKAENITNNSRVIKI